MTCGSRRIYIFMPVYRRDERHRDAVPHDHVRVARDADDVQVGFR